MILRSGKNLRFPRQEQTRETRRHTQEMDKQGYRGIPPCPICPEASGSVQQQRTHRFFRISSWAPGNLPWSSVRRRTAFPKEPLPATYASGANSSSPKENTNPWIGTAKNSASVPRKAIRGRTTTCPLATISKKRDSSFRKTCDRISLSTK